MPVDFKDIEWLKNYFSPKPEKGDTLPNPKIVTDRAVFYLKDSDGVYVEHIMFNGKWNRKVVDLNSNVILEEV